MASCNWHYEKQLTVKEVVWLASSILKKYKDLTWRSTSPSSAQLPARTATLPNPVALDPEERQFRLSKSTMRAIIRSIWTRKPCPTSWTTTESGTSLFASSPWLVRFVVRLVWFAWVIANLFFRSLSKRQVLSVGLLVALSVQGREGWLDGRRRGRWGSINRLSLARRRRSWYNRNPDVVRSLRGQTAKRQGCRCRSHGHPGSFWQHKVRTRSLWRKSRIKMNSFDFAALSATAQPSSPSRPCWARC